MKERVSLLDYGVENNSGELMTAAIQQAIDDAAVRKLQLVFPAGHYLVGSLFLRDDSDIYLEKEACLLGSQNLQDYQQIPTRIAGVEMIWPAGVLNAIKCKRVHLSGGGTVCGQGEFWWHKFWGADEKSGMMQEYIEKGLRWAVDYDCQRPRNILIYECENVEIREIHSVQSGFWNIHLCYSQKVHVDGITVKNSKGPSTDGIDIDSCVRVVVENCYVECNDDNICVKSGRGFEASQLGKVCRDITIRNCVFGKGSGVTLGSETSGGIEQIKIQNIQFHQTGVGFRIKSANNRGGFIRDIEVKDLEMTDVSFPFLLQTNWYPEYSYSRIPEDYKGEVPDYWEKLLQGVNDDLGLTKVENIRIKKVKSTLSSLDIRQNTFSRAFFIEGSAEQPIKNLFVEDVFLDATEFGKISGVEELQFREVHVTAALKTQNRNDSYER